MRNLIGHMVGISSSGESPQEVPFEVGLELDETPLAHGGSLEDASWQKLLGARTNHLLKARRARLSPMVFSVTLTAALLLLYLLRKSSSHHGSMFLPAGGIPLQNEDLDGNSKGSLKRAAEVALRSKAIASTAVKIPSTEQTEETGERRTNELAKKQEKDHNPPNGEPTKVASGKKDPRRSHNEAKGGRPGEGASGITSSSSVESSKGSSVYGNATVSNLENNLREGASRSDTKTDEVSGGRRNDSKKNEDSDDSSDEVFFPDPRGPSSPSSATATEGQEEDTREEEEFSFLGGNEELHSRIYAYHVELRRQKSRAAAASCGSHGCNDENLDSKALAEAKGEALKDS